MNPDSKLNKRKDGHGQARTMDRTVAALRLPGLVLAVAAVSLAWSSAAVAEAVEAAVRLRAWGVPDSFGIGPMAEAGAASD